MKAALATKKILAILFVAIVFFSLAGCGKRYNDSIKDNPEAIAMLEEAIDSLQMCIDGKIGVDRIGDELCAIADKYKAKVGDDAIAEIYRLDISFNGNILNFYAADLKIGLESTAGMIKRVEDAKQQLEDNLYK